MFEWNGEHCYSETCDMIRYDTSSRELSPWYRPSTISNDVSGNIHSGLYTQVIK